MLVYQRVSVEQPICQYSPTYLNIHMYVTCYTVCYIYAPYTNSPLRHHLEFRSSPLEVRRDLFGKVSATDQWLMAASQRPHRE